MTKFLNHVFSKVCSEPRGRGLDELIKQSVFENKENLSGLIEGGRHEWLQNVVDLKALMFALDQLNDYYSGRSIDEEQWTLAAYYSYSYFKIIDEELSKDKTS